MVQHHRYHQLKKGFREEEERQQGDEESQNQTLVLDLANTSSYYRRTKLKLLPLVFFFSLVCFSLIFVPRCINLYSMEVENVDWVVNGDAKSSLCSSMASGSICCDRTSIRSDICFMKGDVRTDSASSSILVYSSNDSMVGNYSENSSNYVQDEEDLVVEKVKPYTRKWETSIMDTVDELDLIVKRNGSEVSSPCDVQHSVPAVVFSTGGYTGNVYHEFNDGLIPLYITSQHLNKNVVFVMLEYHKWWMTKYGDVISRLSKYPPIDFNNDRRTHCFPEVIVGLRIHDELSIDRSRMLHGKSIKDFHNLLDKAYWPRIRGLIQDEEAEAQLSPKAAPVQLKHRKDIQKPKLVIVSRNGSRAITNQHLMVNMAEEIGFEVKVLEPDRTTELAKIYRVLNSSDVMIGVHGAAMTHFLFMKPSTVFIQVIPLGTDWAAETYYGEPSRKLGLNYIEYKVLPSESSLYQKYNKDDPVLRDPERVNARGWEFTKKIYLDGQNVNLDLERFRKRLIRAYIYTISNRRRGHS